MAASRPRDDHGFTLVELLVVILLLGVLATIAIPSLMRNVNKASDATARSDLRNVAVVEEAYAVDNPASYGSAVQLAAVDSLKVSPRSSVFVYTRGSAGFCLVGHAGSSDGYLVYDSLGGGLLRTAQATLAGARQVCTDAGYTAAGSLVNDGTSLRVS